MSKPESIQEFSHREDVYQFSVYRYPELSDLTVIKALKNGSEFVISCGEVLINPNRHLSSDLAKAMKSAGKANPVERIIKDLQNTIVRSC